MKYYYILLFITTYAIAQENDIIKDSLYNNETNLYIKDYKNQLNIKFDVSNDVENYFMKFDGNEVDISPNQNIRYALNLTINLRQ